MTKKIKKAQIEVLQEVLRKCYLTKKDNETIQIMISSLEEQ